MNLVGFSSAMDAVAWRGFVYTIFILHFVFACQFLLLQPLVSALDSKPVNAAELLERVSQSIKVKRYSEALDDLNTAIEADPTLSEAYWHRASILRRFCRYEESEKNYKKFLELKSGNSAAEKELSQLLQAQSALDTASNLYDSGDFTKSLDYIDKVVLVFSPACTKAKLLKVKLLLATKDYSSAISETGYILKEDENNLEALLLRGRAYYYLADHDVALRHFQKGLRLDPEHSELKKTYFGLKNLLKKTKSAEDNENRGKLRLAVEDFKAALALDPNHLAHNVHLHLGLCNVLVKLGRGKDAVSSCTEALNIDGELIEALVQRGEAKLLIEDWEGAVEDLKSAAQALPQDMNIRDALSRAEKSLKMSKRKDWYKILGVSKTASISEIKRAYKKLALQWHPDKNVDNREEAEAQFREIAAAYEVLGDDDKRARYDRGEDLEDMGMGGGGGGGGFNPFGGGGQQFTFHFEGGFPEEAWHDHTQIFDNNLFYPPPCNPVFFNGMFYCLGLDRSLGVFNPKENGTWTVCALPEQPCGSPCQIFLMECDGELISVFVGFMGTWVSIFQPDNSKMVWREVEDLGDRMLFVSSTTCLSARKVINGMENKIYFPRFHGKFGVFYSLATRRFQTFGKDYCRKNFCKTKEWLYCSWIVPNEDSHSREELNW